MDQKTCPECFDKLRELQAICGACGYKVELVSKEQDMERYLKRPSLGGLFWTQAYAFGTRQYLWFILSILPITGFVALPAMFLFGRRWSWRVGGWENFETFKKRQLLMDRIGIAWIILLALIYAYLRFLK